MIDIQVWISGFANAVERTFADRVWFMGLQGSYGRGEATETSDIDIVVILDELCMSDLKRYRDMLDALPNRELACGFISGKNELLNWETSDLFQFYFDTTPIKGSLDCLLAKIDEQSIKRAIRTGACNIYHACAHNFLHEKSEDILRSLYKSAVFVIQAEWFLTSGKYVRSKTELQKAIYPLSAVLDAALECKNGASLEFEKLSDLLLNWAKEVIDEYGKC